MLDRKSTISARHSAPRRRSRSFVLVAAAAILIVVTSACGDDSSSADTTSASASATTLAGTSWTLAEATIADKSVAAVAEATLAFDANGTAVSGSTGCNRFAGTYTQTDSNLAIALGPVTLAACTDPAATAQETAILAQLPNVAAFTNDSQLVLLDSNGKKLLTYEKGLTSLAGTSWTATGINNGKGAVASSAITSNVTADFGADGTVSGSSGCNTYTGTYELSGSDGISITGVATTRKACAEDLMTLESQYLAALTATTTFEISGSTLKLADSSGSTQVTYALKA
ncbi:MAG TPA: META domain-containing protein [Ilumatobacteraceae bacterium]|nr:META domain-containing protein [Ilumatobacteraceae bacterium]